MLFFLTFLFCIGITYILYLIPKKLGYPKLGKLLSIIVGLSFASLTFFIVFEDILFSKKNAIDLLKEQQISLNDKFVILDNKSMTSIGDYYHTFTLKISEKDKNRIISEIKCSDNFKNIGESIFNITQLTDYYLGDRITQNYETDTEFIRKLFEPKGKGYVPTYRVIRISKNGNKLVFEDIDE